MYSTFYTCRIIMCYLILHVDYVMIAGTFVVTANERYVGVCVYMCVHQYSYVVYRCTHICILCICAFMDICVYL